MKRIKFDLIEVCLSHTLNINYQKGSLKHVQPRHFQKKVGFTLNNE